MAQDVRFVFDVRSICQLDGLVTLLNLSAQKALADKDHILRSSTGDRLLHSWHFGMEFGLVVSAEDQRLQSNSNTRTFDLVGPASLRLTIGPNSGVLGCSVRWLSFVSNLEVRMAMRTLFWNIALDFCPSFGFFLPDSGSSAAEHALDAAYCEVPFEEIDHALQDEGWAVDLSDIPPRDRFQDCYIRDIFRSPA